MRLINYILTVLFIGFVGCSAGSGLEPGEQETQLNPPLPNYTPPPARKNFTCSVVSTPSPAVVSAFGNAGTGDLVPGTSAPTVQYKILGALDGVATLISLTGISLDSTKVSQVSAPTELADKSFIATYQPIKGGVHNISFNIVVRGDASYMQTCSTTLQLNLTMPPALAVSIDANPIVVSNGGVALVNMTSVNATDCNIDRDGSTLLRAHPLLSDTFSTGPLFNPTNAPIVTQYRATCFATATTAPADTVDITINPAPTAQLGIVSGPNLIDSTVIGVNGSATLSWQSSYALAGCSIRDQMGTLVGNDPLPTASGTINVNLIPASRTFTLTCRDNVMTTVTDPVQVNVAAPGVTLNITSDAAITKTMNDHQLSNGATFYRVDFTHVDVVAGSCSIAEGLVNITSQIPKVVNTAGMAATVTYSATCTSISGGTVSATATVKKPPCTGTVEIGRNGNGKWDPFVIRGFVNGVTPGAIGDAPHFDQTTAQKICSLNATHKGLVEFDDYDGNGYTNFAYNRGGYESGSTTGWNGTSWRGGMSNNWIAKLICGCQ